MELGYMVASAGGRMKRDVATLNNASVVYRSYSPEPGKVNRDTDFFSGLSFYACFQILGELKSTQVSTCFFKGPDIEIASVRGVSSCRDVNTVILDIATLPPPSPPPSKWPLLAKCPRMRLIP